MDVKLVKIDTIRPYEASPGIKDDAVDAAGTRKLGLAKVHAVRLEKSGGPGMIFHPKPGQRVRIHYARRWWPMPYQGRTGVVRILARGRGPRNVGVEIEGRIIVVPRGNLVAVPSEDHG